MTHKLIKTTDYILVVDDSLTIGKGYAVNRDYKIMKYNTDEHLAYDSYAVKKIIAHFPLNGSPILEGVDLLPPYHQEDGLDKFELFLNREVEFNFCPKDIIERIKWYYQTYFKPKENYKYTEEDVRKAITMARDLEDWQDLVWVYEYDYIIQSLHQYPTEFECEMETVPHPPPSRGFSVVPKTITTAQGIQWVGKYK
jgi:hypothetical protein